MFVFRSLFFLLICWTSITRAEEAFSAGAPMQGPVAFVYALYYPSAPAVAPVAALATAATKLGGQVTLVQQFGKEVSAPQASATWLTNAQDSFTPPNMQQIRYFGRGLSPQQAEELQLAKLALVVEFRLPAAANYAGLRAADRLLAEVAEQTKGLIWDEETREIFTVAAWRERHIDSWQGDIPNVAKHTVIHAYQGDKLLRGITLGMAKFGLPDVLMNDFPRSNSAQAGDLIVALSQALVEGAVIGPRSNITLDLSQFKHIEVKKTQQTALADNARGTAQLYFTKGKREEGDPQNRLLEFYFDHYPGPDRYARQTALFTTLYGFHDGIMMIKHNDAILAASKAAKARLPALRVAFNAGLRTGEYIMVKAPFATPDDGNEWMWVEVTRWDEQEITGVLNNEPANVPKLHSGQIVKVKVADVFDYIRYDGQGNEEGNESGKLIAKQRAGK